MWSHVRVLVGDIEDTHVLVSEVRVASCPPVTPPGCLRKAHGDVVSKTRFGSLAEGPPGPRRCHRSGYHCGESPPPRGPRSGLQFGLSVLGDQRQGADGESQLRESESLPGSLADHRGADSGEAGGQAGRIQDAFQVGADGRPPGKSTGAGLGQGLYMGWVRAWDGVGAEDGMDNVWVASGPQVRVPGREST